MTFISRWSWTICHNLHFSQNFKQNASSSSSSVALWGNSVKNLPPHPGSDGPPHGPTKERKEKKEQGERNGVGRMVLLRCGPTPETSPDNLQFTSKDHTVNIVRLNNLLWKKKKTKCWCFEFFDYVVGKLCRESTAAPGQRWTPKNLQSPEMRLCRSEIFELWKIPDNEGTWRKWWWNQNRVGTCPDLEMKRGSVIVMLLDFAELQEVSKGFERIRWWLDLGVEDGCRRTRSIGFSLL